MASKKSFIFNQKGQSIVQVMISLAIMTIAIGGITTMLANQNKELKALSQKQASLEFQRYLSAVLLNKNSCARLFNKDNLINPNSIRFRKKSVKPNSPKIIKLNKIPDRVGATPLAKPGEAVSLIAPSLTVKEKNGLQVRVTGLNTAIVEVNYEASTLVRGIRNVSMPITLETEITGPIAEIVGCSGAGSLNMEDVCAMLNYTYDDSKATPVCMPPLVDQKESVCAAFRGSWNNRSQTCTFRQANYGCGGGAIVALKSNVERMIYKIAMLGFYPEFKNNEVFHSRMQSLRATKNMSGVVGQIYSLMGVNSQKTEEVDKFLKTKDFHGTSYIKTIQENLDMDKSAANLFLKETAQTLSGD